MLDVMNVYYILADDINILFQFMFIYIIGFTFMLKLVIHYILAFIIV